MIGSIIKFIRNIIISRYERMKAIDNLLMRMDIWAQRIEGIESFGHTLAAVKTEIEILKTKTDMIISFMGIKDRRHESRPVTFERRRRTE